jgi:hypothetical protein
MATLLRSGTRNKISLLRRTKSLESQMIGTQVRDALPWRDLHTAAKMPGRVPRWLRGTDWFQTLKAAQHRHRLRDWWKRGRPLEEALQAPRWMAVLHWADLIDAKYFVEAGTYLGDTVRELYPRFDRVVTIELSQELAEQAKREFRHVRGVEVVQGDSGIELQHIVQTLHGPTIFLLDSHWAGSGTASNAGVPVMAELECIAGFTYPHAVIVDDMHLFNGTNGFPERESFRNTLTRLGYWHVFTDNELQAVPRAVISQVFQSALEPSNEQSQA